MIKILKTKQLIIISIVLICTLILPSFTIAQKKYTNKATLIEKSKQADKIMQAVQKQWQLEISKSIKISKYGIITNEQYRKIIEKGERKLKKMDLKYIK